MILDVYDKFKKYLHNTLWIMSDKLISMVIVFFLTVLVARHLGPENFGVLSYAISVAALLAAAGHMGLGGLVVRELVKKPDERGATLGTSLALKLVGMVAGYVVLLVYAAIYEGVGSLEFIAIAIAGAALLFNPFNVVDFWFQAFVQAKYVTFARLAGLTVASLLNLVFVFMGAGVIYFVTTTLIQAIVIAISLLTAYKIRSSLRLSEWKFNGARAKDLFSQGWLVYLGSIFAVINLKMDQVMLRWFEGAESVGVYAVAAQLSEAWYFVPVAIVASFFPKLIELKEKDPYAFNKRLQQLFDLLFVLALAIALVMTLFSEKLIIVFFGYHYIESASILVIHTWAAIFIFMRAAFSKWILIEGALVFSLITQGLGALVNVVLNYFLIPRYGAEGAAYATLVSYACSSFFSLLIYSKTRPIFFMMLKSLFWFIRLAGLRGFR
ncbi:flippase [Halopseudomonas sp.]|uniref:flippase n=1 Tax=Halopseudomonas sp. TaxID=2901191 RepID=UPI00300124F0